MATFPAGGENIPIATTSKLVVATGNPLEWSQRLKWSEPEAAARLRIVLIFSMLVAISLFAHCGSTLKKNKPR
jgi:hypothetical protein